MKVPEAQELRLVGLLARITYKPGWWFTVYKDGEGGVTRDTEGAVAKAISIARYEADITNPSKNLIVGTAIVISIDELEQMPDEMIVDRILRTVCGMELHEAYEWFKFNGEHRIDPHPELKPPVILKSLEQLVPANAGIAK